MSSSISSILKENVFAVALLTVVLIAGAGLGVFVLLSHLGLYDPFKISISPTQMNGVNRPKATLTLEMGTIAMAPRTSNCNSEDHPHLIDDNNKLSPKRNLRSIAKDDYDKSPLGLTRLSSL
tara:strand:+ start:257 stop:622 length:366 start_codon:yes stop_codon:yes gene_type:complete